MKSISSNSPASSTTQAADSKKSPNSQEMSSSNTLILNSEEKAYLGTLEQLFISPPRKAKEKPNTLVPRHSVQEEEEDEEFAENDDESSENAPTKLEMLRDLNELRLLLKHSHRLHQTFKPQLTALTPLSYRPDLSTPVWRNSGEPIVKAVVPLMNDTAQLASEVVVGFPIKIVASYIPGFFGFSQSPLLVRPLKSLETGIEYSASFASGVWSAVPKEQGPLATILSATDAVMEASLTGNIWFLPKTGFSAIKQHYQWDPREARVQRFTASLQGPVNHLHSLVVSGLTYANKYGKIELPYPQQFTLRNSALVNDSIHALAAVTGIKDADYSLILNSFKAAGSFKTLKDLDFYGWRDFYSVMEPAHLLVGGLAVAPAIFDFSKNLMELYKHRSFLTKPYALTNEMLEESKKNSALWPQDNYPMRVSTYHYLTEALLGDENGFSAFEQKIQNLFYNLTLSGEALGAASQLNTARAGYGIYHFASGLMNKMDGYDWYPHAFEQVFGDVVLSSDPIRNKIFHHCFNRLIWSELVIPVGIQLPLRGINTAVLRALAEKMFNNDEFIFKLRVQIDRILKSILINPSELAKFEHFELPKTDEENPLEAAVSKILEAVKTVEVGAGVVSDASFFFRREESTVQALRRIGKELNVSPSQVFVNFMSACPIRTGQELSYEEMLSEQPREAPSPMTPFDTLLEKAMAEVDVKGLTLAKKGKSYIEILITPISYPLVSVVTWAWDEWNNNPKAILSRIQKASTVAELPEFDVLEARLRAYVTDESYTTAALCHDEEEVEAYILPFKTAYDAKLIELKRKTTEAKNATHALFERYEKLHASLKAEQMLEVSLQLRDDLALFERDVAKTIADNKDYPDASYYANLSSETPSELKKLLALRDEYTFKNLCFNVFVEHLNNSETGRVDDLNELVALVVEKDASQSPLLSKMQKDLEQLDKEDDAIKDFVAASGQFLNTMISLHKEFVSAKSTNTLNALSYKKLKTALEETSTRHMALSAPLKGEFFAAVAEGFTLSLAKFQEEITLIEKDLSRLKTELEPIEQLFVKMQGKELGSLPSFTDIATYRSLLKQSSLSSQYQLVLDDERKGLLANKNEEAFKQLLLKQLDAVAESFTAKVGEQLERKPQKGVHIINEQTAAFFAAVEPLKKHFPDDLALEQNIAQFKAQMMAFHRKVLTNELEGYLALVDKATDLPSKSRLSGAVSPFSFAQIVKICEFINPHLAYHEDACKEVLKKLGLPLGQENNLDLKQVLLAHTQKQLFSLLNRQLAKVSLSGKDDLAKLCSMQESLLTTEISDFFNGDKEPIRKHIANYFEAAMPTLVDNYLKKLQEHIKEQQKLINSGRRNIPFFAKQSLSQEEYDKEIRGILEKLDSFEPKEYRAMAIERIKALVEELNPVSQQSPRMTS